MHLKKDRDTNKTTIILFGRRRKLEPSQLHSNREYRNAIIKYGQISGGNFGSKLKWNLYIKSTI